MFPVNITNNRICLDTVFLIAQGFEHHINYEHHIWAYIFFFIHLHDTKPSDYTSLELFVFKLVST